tara:strand:- start:1025 stop:2443 length:1419 start_codon:yes stop_codon:yes gene_type:complete
MAWTLSGDYYVDAVAGDDTNAGTSTAPFKTIQKAIQEAEDNGSGYQDIIVGAGTYTDRLVAGTTTNYLCFKADGEVIFDASSTGDSAFYNGNLWRVEGFKIVDVEQALQKSSNDAYRVNFHKCYIKNCPDWYIDAIMAELSKYHDTNCIFENCGSTNISTTKYARYWAFTNCMFINSWMPGYRANGDFFSSNTFTPPANSCVFINTEDNGITNYYMSSAQYGAVRNCVFNEHAVYRNTTTIKRSGSALADYFDTNTSHYWEAGAIVASASFNTDISGSNMMSDAMFTLAGTTSNKDYFQNYRLGTTGRFAGTKNMATAYGYQDIASNPFHTAGGATWTNITASNTGGLQISASTHPTGTIESAVIDQGSVKVIRQIKTSFTSTVLGATGISAHTASVDNKFPTRQTFEMRFGNTSNLSSTDYQIFDTDLPTYVDLNGSGSGDVGFNTGSFSLPSARYLQLKFTLRTNMTGSA